ncbi:MAG: histidine--tRNA ligase [Bacteroidetes bacterium GWE2_41_25]|nr:MAG: histidine--tRNA ligase [Bacteroidetes bacterium GWA2_40_15]OFX97180.1 MAG: histidine--tRNA ligase [Bacteroidetes bacterium GWC2_40_22]OFY05074.1 MAG: histidine--tRNA ligase [Bacteroidetes bacterium GWE2_41_25]OFY59327.1 MAG: histidine--tRNA ligase [Bacteroidetes bacterium GWF2_41_9]HBH85649.1 histidine--tRNA ligase [Bacteroidales bacterium]
MSSKPSIPKGTRDFSTEEMQRREYIFDTIRQVFRLYGYQPIETPALENLSTLLGKYGDEGDKLLFRILNSGDYLSDVSMEELLKRDSGKLSSRICEKGLRYDLTVPFARYVVQHRDEIVFPFKRYQIQPVWRADRPQKGRYREFFQCDVDVIGSDSLLNEYELVRIIDDIFSRLHISIITKINNRKILSGIAEYIGEGSRITDITVAIDKLDKIGIDSVNAELREKGVSIEAINKLQPLLSFKGDSDEKLSKLEELLSLSVTGLKGIAEVRTLFSYLGQAEMKGKVELDLTLARGLNYYTGAIIEVKSTDVSIGSICGGGRYDNLAGVFGMEGVSGVGVSFGADRIYDVLKQLDLFDDTSISSSEVLIVNFGESETSYALSVIELLRKLSIRSELYPDPVKLKKQISYADSKKIPFLIIAGADEIQNNCVTIKNMTSGDQEKVSLNELRSYAEKNFKISR